MTCYLIFASKYPGGTAGRGEWAGGDGTRQAVSCSSWKLGDRHMGVHYSLTYHLSLLLYKFEFSTMKLFVKNKGKTKIFPSNKGKITKKQEGKAIVQMELVAALRAGEAVWEEQCGGGVYTRRLCEATLPPFKHPSRNQCTWERSSLGHFRRTSKLKKQARPNLLWRAPTFALPPQESSCLCLLCVSCL